METIHLEDKFRLFSAHWTPHIIGELNGQFVKLVKVSGEFVWHDHAQEDELFFVFKGTLYVDFADQPTRELGPGDLLIIPRGVQHRPHTKDGEEVWMMLFEPKATKHTGEVEHEITVKELNWI